MALVCDFLRFEPKIGFTLLGAELQQVVEAFVKGAGVGGFVAHVKGEVILVGDGAGIGVDAGVLETLSTFSEPMGFGHVVDEDGLGGRERIVR